eukprot:m.7527 g.7527  ORF g.7527 m.7527 type:complete len:235 (+) comp5980_c0_seq1:211-915(+)
MPIVSEKPGSRHWKREPRLAFGKGVGSHINRDFSRAAKPRGTAEDPNLGPASYAFAYRHASPFISPRSQISDVLTHIPPGLPDKSVFGSSLPHYRHGKKRVKTKDLGLSGVGLPHGSYDVSKKSSRPFGSGVSRFSDSSSSPSSNSRSNSSSSRSSSRVPFGCSVRPSSMDRSGRAGADSPAVGTYFRDTGSPSQIREISLLKPTKAKRRLIVDKPVKHWKETNGIYIRGQQLH